MQGKASLSSGRVALRVGECCYSDDAVQTRARLSTTEPAIDQAGARDGVGRVRREFPGRPTDGQKAADAMVKAGRSSSASGSGRRSQRRSWRAPHVQAAETSPSIEDRVAVRADTAAAQDGLTPQLIYPFPRLREMRLGCWPNSAAHRPPHTFLRDGAINPKGGRLGQPTGSGAS